MENQHFEILKRGKEEWNEWRKAHPEVIPDLSNLTISLTPPSFASPREMHKPIVLAGFDLRKCDFYRSKILGANFSFANLTEASFKEADLRRSNFSLANLTRASFHRSNLTLCNFYSADLNDTLFWETVLARVNFNKTKNLENTRHGGPSIIDHRTFVKSGKIHPDFLDKLGLPKHLMLANKRLTPKKKTKSCFISHSSKDSVFVESLYQELQDRNVKCWYAPKDLDYGDKTREEIDEAIKRTDKLLIVLSYNSINSYWVEDEVEAAIDWEIKHNKIKLLPIMIDSDVFQSETPWFTKIRRNRNIGDFSAIPTKEEKAEKLEKLIRAINK